MKTCFVSTPFGIKPTSQGGSVDFDFLYKEVIKPVVSKHGYNCVRIDELKGSAVIHTAQLAAIMNSDAMIVDVSTHNGNTLEYVFKYDEFPVDIKANDTNYRKYTRD